MTPLIEGTQPEGLTTQELAERLGKTPQTVRNWLDAGMPCLFRGGRKRPSRFDEAACRRWIAANKSGLGRGGERDGAGRPARKKKTKKPTREARGHAAWRSEPEHADPMLVSDEMLDEAERRRKAGERIVKLANTTGAEAAIDPEVVALEHQLCKLTHADLVLLAHLVPAVTGLNTGAVQRLEKLETIQARQVEREKAAGRLLDAAHVRDTYERLFGDLRAMIDAGPKDAARDIAAALELDGEQFKKVEKVLKQRAEALVASLREVGQKEAEAA